MNSLGWLKQPGNHATAFSGVKRFIEIGPDGGRCRSGLYESSPKRKSVVREGQQATAKAAKSLTAGFLEGGGGMGAALEPPCSKMTLCDASLESTNGS